MSPYLRPFTWYAFAAVALPIGSALAAPAASPASAVATPSSAATTAAPSQAAANAPTKGAANAQIQGDSSAAAVTTTNNAPSPSNAALPAGDAIPEPLTIEQAIALGLARNPSISGGAAGVAAAQANYKSLGAFPNITASVSNAHGTSSAPTLNGTTHDTFVDLGDSIDTSGQRRLSAKGAKATYRATVATQAETKITLEQQIRDAYWSLVAARAQTSIANEGLADAQKINDATQLQQTAGASPRIDVLRSNIDLANAKQGVTGAQGDEASALAALNALLARSPGADLQLADTLDENGTSPLSPIDLPALDQLTSAAIAKRPAVLAAREQVTAAALTTKGTKASRFPDLSVDYERSFNDPIASVVLGASLPLFDFGSIGHSVRAAKEGEKQAFAQQQQAEAGVAQAVEQAYRDLTQAQKLAVSYRTDILEPSKTLLDMAQLGLQQGATGILPVLDAESTLRDARTGYIQNLLSFMKAQDELLAATGAAHIEEIAVPASAAPTPAN